jgi:hypothetical protein
VWDRDAILLAAAEAVEAEERRLADEQAVHGLDSYDELSFHALIAGALARTGLGVLREQPYPHEWRRKRPPPAATGPTAHADDDSPLPLPRDRQRCDLILTPGPGRPLADPLDVVKTARAARRLAAGTLFESVMGEPHEPPPAGAPGVPPDEAFWLEVKLIGQYTYIAGIPGPNRAYASELVRGVRSDLAKLDADPMIVHSALLLILFTQDQGAAEHDLIVVMHRCLDRNLPVCAPLRHRVSIADRIGNRVCTVGLIGLSRA